MVSAMLSRFACTRSNYARTGSFPGAGKVSRLGRFGHFLLSSRSCSENLVRENGLGRAKPPLPRATRGSQGWTDVPEEHRSLARRSSLQPTREILVHETSPPLLS